MGLWTNIRTENMLGPYLSKTFQSLINGPEIDGINCELNQLSKLLNLDLTPFTIENYSRLWDESEFPEDEKEILIKRQIEADKIWNDLTDFVNLIDRIINSFKTGVIAPNQLKHKLEWWNGYFNFPNEKDGKDSFFVDLMTIKDFLLEAKEKGESKTAFYVE